MKQEPVLTLNLLGNKLLMDAGLLVNYILWDTKVVWKREYELIIGAEELKIVTFLSAIVNALMVAQTSRSRNIA